MGTLIMIIIIISNDVERDVEMSSYGEGMKSIPLLVTITAQLPTHKGGSQSSRSI